MNVLDLLLKTDVSKYTLPEKEFKIKSLSEKAGEDVIFKVRAIGLDRLEELRETNSGMDLYIMVVTDSVADPSLKDEKLKEKFGAATPKDLIKRLLLPGEIEALYLGITRMSGYGHDAVEEIKKK